MNAADSPLADVRAALIRITGERQPIDEADLYRQASRDTHRMTPIAFSEMQDLIGEGFLVPADDGTVSLADPPPVATEEAR